MDWRTARDLIEIVGGQSHTLDLEAHSSMFQDHAPQLSALLERAGVQAVARTYSEFDRDAVEAAARYKIWMCTANLAALITSCATAAAMSWALAVNDARWLQAGLLQNGDMLLGAIASSAAMTGAVSLYVLRHGRLLESWMAKRAAAESHRTAYFEEVVKRAVAQPAPVALLALEYFRRYHFDVQKAYFLKRARQHERSGQKTVALGAVGAGLAALTSVVGLTSEYAQHVMGALTVNGAALGAFAIGREQLTQDHRNSERYIRTYANLVELSRKLDDVRDAAQEGGAQAVLEFVMAVDEHISNEHRQWLEKTEATKAAIARLEEILGKRAAAGNG
ncbi:hypothetical protein [Paracoccus tibetensis]|uniref:SMODS and SLOG-associating 2TM effector domain-containing protein n=1 Tax=Paracoccus tibetensis TaxID=336292 RepID=A0A1G5K0Y5_9RHOB|nr:hypothetical protein [Paracoccus tibetensis]SCY94104.1 hypothetical protein SAMN05660710_03600 [Paracoccus tibetensis]